MWSLGLSKIVSGIYDKIIINMTEVWYKTVLERQNQNAIILDVGIGTAGALLRCKDTIKSKNLHIIGVDYNDFYIKAAEEYIKDNEMEDYITVHPLNIYDEIKVHKVLEDSIKGDVKKVDSVYFSGSFSLLPDPSGALLAVKKVLKEGSGRIFITQTYQKRTLPLLSQVKPMLKYVTTIDFGQLIKVDEVETTLTSVESEGLVLKEHEKIKDSIDSYLQAAYLSILSYEGMNTNPK